MTDHFAEFFEDQPAPRVRETTTEQKFPCGQCAGTGVYQGARVHQEKSHCFACRGKGYFKTDPRKLKKARAAAAKRKQDAKVAVQEINEALPIFKDVVENKSWNSFAASLFDQHMNGRAWTERQIAAFAAMMDKARATRAAKDKAALQVDLTGVVEMFNTAKENGLKRPKYRAEGVVLSLAGPNSANAGAIYVKSTDGEYLGKVVAGKAMLTRAAAAYDAEDKLKAIAASPLDVAVAYGRKVGACACCGRELTDPKSIEAGIGPICADKWGF